MPFQCKICNKDYYSYQSLWNHNKKFHPKVDNNVNNKLNTDVCIESPTIKCTYCNAQFTTRQAKSLHIKKYCKQKQEIDAKKEENKEALQLQILKQETKRIKEEAKILKLKNKIEKADKENNKLTLKKINKHLENFEKLQFNMINSKKTILCDLQKINIHGFLTRQEKINIANKRHDSLEALVEKIYCGKVNKYKVVIVNNSSNNDIHLFVEKHNSFILEDKKEVLNKIIEFALGDLETIYDEVNDSIENLTKNSLRNFIHKLNYDKTKYKTDNGKVFETYRQFIEYKLNKMFYNNREKIMNDISNYIIRKEKELECV